MTSEHAGMQTPGRAAAPRHHDDVISADDVTSAGELALSAALVPTHAHPTYVCR